MTDKFWPATALTGGGTGALDGIDGSNLGIGHGAVVITATGTYIYRVEDSGTTESSPDVITPDLNAGSLRWHLENFFANIVNTNQVKALDSGGLLLTDDAGNGIEILDGGIVQTVDGNSLLNQSNLASNGGSIVDHYSTETNAGQGSQVIPITNNEGFLDQSWIAPVYGIRWDSVNDTYQAGIVQGGSFIATDYTSFPIQEKMGRGLLTAKGGWTKLDPNDSTLLLDGSSATLDGSAGQVMVYVPKHYQLAVTDGDYKYFLISEQQFTFKGLTAWIPPVFLDKDEFYVGAFQGVALSDSTSANVGSCVLDTSGYSNNSYPNPYTNQTRGNFRTYCSNTGESFCQWSYGMYETIYILALIEYKTWAIQEQLEGHTERSSFNYSECTKAGATTGLGDYSGTIYDDTDGLNIANSYRGIENFFGNVWQWVDGINIDTNDNQRVWTAFDPSNFADDTTTDYINTGVAPGFDGNDNYQKDVYGQDKHAPTWPVTLNDGADSGSYITDYFWSNALGSGWRVVQVGGTSYGGRLAGFGGRSSNASSSTSNDAIGVRLGAYI